MNLRKPASSEPPAARLKMRFFIWAVILTALPAFGWALIAKRHIGSEVSPDGNFRADYFYRVRGPIDLLAAPRTNPYLFLEVVDLRSGKRFIQHEGFGDYASVSDAGEFFAPQLPWEILR